MYTYAALAPRPNEGWTQVTYGYNIPMSIYVAVFP